MFWTVANGGVARSEEQAGCKHPRVPTQVETLDASNDQSAVPAEKQRGSQGCGRRIDSAPLLLTPFLFQSDPVHYTLCERRTAKGQEEFEIR